MVGSSSRLLSLVLAALLGALSCGSGYRWDQTVCDCVCDTASLSCDPKYQADEQLCACVCKPDCGNTCEGGTTCNESLCACIPIGG